MAGSSSIQLKEVHIRMSGTASNRNYGNLSPDVKLIFIADGLENWSEGLQQMVATTHEAFENAARKLVNDFEGVGSSGKSLLHELGIKPQTSISIHGTHEGVTALAQRITGAVPRGDDGEYDPDFDDDGFGDEEDDDDFDDAAGYAMAEDEDTKEVDTSHFIGAD